MTDTLTEICQQKREHIRKRRQYRSEASLLEEAPHALPVRGFRRALARKSAKGYGLIAEIKKASPSKGLIRADFDPARLAEAYARGGAACLSVLTDVPYFQGDDAYLGQARAAVELPALRKDFMLEPYQIIESRVLGADCILLIMACLSDAQANELLHAATSLGMDALVEVHDEAELDRALHLRGATMIGINNRDLKTLKVDLATAERLAKRIPDTMLAVGESGLSVTDDLKRLEACGIRCFLVGESLMREDDVEAATKRLLGQE